MDILLVGTPTHQKFTGGSISLTQPIMLRTKAFQPYITDYQHTVTVEDSPYKPLNFRRGTIGIRVVAYQRLLVTPSSEHQFVNGSITFLRTGVASVGGLSRFSFWPTGYPDDPANVLLEATNPVSGVAGAQQGWSRISSIVHPSPTARFLGLGGKFMAVPHSPTGGVTYRNYVRKVQVEKAYADGSSFPTSYERARQVNVTVKPSRVNLAVVSSPAAENATKTTGVTFDGVTWDRFAVAAGTGGARIHASLSGLKTGKYYTIQAEVANDGASPITVLIDWVDLNATPYVILPGTRRVISTTGNRNGLAYDSTNRYGDVEVAGGSNFLIRNVMIERGTEVKPFFNGSTNSDTVWGGTAGASMSFLYKDRVARYAALQRILEKNVPMGIGVGDPQFGILPADW